MNVYSSTRFSGLIFEDEMIYLPRTARYVVRNQAKTAEDAEKARANINIYSSTRFSGLIFEDEMISIPRTARYVVQNQAKTAEDAESTSEHQRIQQYAIFRFNF